MFVIKKHCLKFLGNLKVISYSALTTSRLKYIITTHTILLLTFDFCCKYCALLNTYLKWGSVESASDERYDEDSYSGRGDIPANTFNVLLKA